MLTMKKLRRMKRPEGMSLKKWAAKQGAQVFPVHVGGEAVPDYEASPKVAKLLGVPLTLNQLEKQEKEREAHKARRGRSHVLRAATYASRRKKKGTSGPTKKDKDALPKAA